MDRHHAPNWKLWDGGKIGGKPSWLNPRDIPKDALRCPVCAKREHTTCTINNSTNEGTMLRFVAQIYSPADSETGNEHAFHRTFYVFCCPHPLCSTSENVHESVVILRGQISQQNEFYPYECSDDDDDDGDGQDKFLNDELNDWKLHKSDAWDVDLCHVCGQIAKGKCPVANEYFCGKEHQRLHHKMVKQAKKENSNEVDLSSLIYTESELVVEEEPDESGKDEKLENVMSKKPLFADSEDVDDDGVDDGLLEQSDLNQMTGINSIGGTSDMTTIEFYSRIGRICEDGKDVKGQCLRYNRWPATNDDVGKGDDVGAGADEEEDDAGNGPLWISSSHRPTSQEDIPPCQYCGAERKFEFQLMPQIINFLKTKASSSTTKDDSGKDKKKEGVSPNENKDRNTDNDGHQVLLAASDIIKKAKEEGKENELPKGFEETQKNLVEKLKKQVFDEGASKGNDDIDFGVISVYSCTASCGEGKVDLYQTELGAYRKEFAWRQPPL